MINKYDKLLFLGWSDTALRNSNSRRRLQEKAKNNNISFESVNLNPRESNIKLDKKTAEKIIPFGDCWYYTNLNDGKVTLATKRIDNGKCDIIEFKDINFMRQYIKENIYKTIRNATNNSKVYIFGHGLGPEEKNMYDRNFKSISYDELASIIAQNPDFKKVPADKPPVKISLIMCHAAEGHSDGEQSFAYNFSRALANKGVYARVVARKYNAIFVYDERIPLKLVDCIHHGSNSKFSFETSIINKDGLKEADKTLICPVVYKDNIPDQIFMLSKVKDLYNYIKTAENENESPSFKQDKVRWSKVQLAKIAYNLAVDWNSYKTLGKEFEEINKMMLGESSNISYRKVYQLIIDFLTKNINDSLRNGYSLNENCIEQVKMFERLDKILDEKQTKLFSDETKLDYKIGIKIQRKFCKFGRERFGKYVDKSIDQLRLSQNIDSNTMQTIYEYSKLAVDKKIPASSQDYSLYIKLEAFNILLAKECLSRGIKHESINIFSDMDKATKYISSLKHNEKSSKSNKILHFLSFH